MIKPLLLASLSLLVACRPGVDGQEISRRILPGQTLATFVPGQADATPLLSELSIFLAQPARQGQLRVRLVNAESQPGKALPQPGTHNLLSSPVLLLPQMLSVTNGRLPIELRTYQVNLPHEGLFVVVECQATNPAEQTLGITVANENSKDPLTQVVLSSETDSTAVAHVVPAAEYPALLAQYGGRSRSITYLRTAAAPAWLSKPSAPVTVRIEPQFAEQ